MEKRKNFITFSQGYSQRDIADKIKVSVGQSIKICLI